MVKTDRGNNIPTTSPIGASRMDILSWTMYGTEKEVTRQMYDWQPEENTWSKQFGSRLILMALWPRFAGCVDLGSCLGLDPRSTIWVNLSSHSSHFFKCPAQWAFTWTYRILLPRLVGALPWHNCCDEPFICAPPPWICPCSFVMETKTPKYFLFVVYRMFPFQNIQVKRCFWKILSAFPLWFKVILYFPNQCCSFGIICHPFTLNVGAWVCTCAVVFVHLQPTRLSSPINSS